MRTFKIYILQLLLAACGSENEVPDPTLIPDNDPTDRIVAFGDSLTQGSVYPSGHYSFVYHVSSAIGLRVINAGKGGSRIADDGQLGRIKRMVYRPTDKVLFLSGYNDMRLGTQVSSYEASLREALEHLSPNVAKVYLGTCLINGNEARSEEFRAVQIQVASSYPNVVIVDTTREARLTPGQFYDGVHPTLEGVAIIGEAFVRKM